MGGAAPGTAPTFAARPRTSADSARMVSQLRRVFCPICVSKSRSSSALVMLNNVKNELERSRQRSRVNAKYQHKEGSRPFLREDSRATLGRGVYESVRVLMENHPVPCHISLLSKCSLQQPRAQWVLHEAERQVPSQGFQLWFGQQNLRVFAQQPT